MLFTGNSGETHRSGRRACSAPLWTGLQNSFQRIRRHCRRCVTSSPSTLAPQLLAARRILPFSLQSRHSCSLSGNLSMGCSSTPGRRNAPPFQSVMVPAHELCWTPSCLNHPDVLERKRRGYVLTLAGTPKKTACFHPLSLRAPLSNGVSFTAGHVLQVQRITQCFTAVIMDPHSIKSKFTLHTFSLTRMQVPRLLWRALIRKNKPSHLPFHGLGSHSGSVELGFKNNSRRLLASVRSQATSLQRCHSNFCSGQRSARSPTRSAEIVCKRSCGISAPSEQ